MRGPLLPTLLFSGACAVALWAGGYLHTRDMVSIDAAGYVQIRDRAKDMIKSGGEWISSLQLEELIARHPGVAEVAVIAIPDERWGERPLAVVVPRHTAGDPLSFASVIHHLQGYVEAGVIPRYALPERLELVASLPRTSVGKLDKKAVRRQFH